MVKFAFADAAANNNVARAASNNEISAAGNNAARAVNVNTVRAVNNNAARAAGNNAARTANDNTARATGNNAARAAERPSLIKHNLGESFIDDYGSRVIRISQNSAVPGGYVAPVSRVEFGRSKAATPGEIKASLEKATEHRQKLLSSLNVPLISVSLNAPGPYKQFPLAALCLKECVRTLEIAMEAAGVPLVRQEPPKREGAVAFAYFSADGTAENIKRVLCDVEETHPLGKLFNLDLYTGGKNGERAMKISRSDVGLKHRTCLLCGNSASSCAYNRKHKTDDLVNKSLEMMWSWVRQYLAERINTTSTRALCGGLATTPKPGLVDRANCGSLTNIDYFTFIDSLAELLPYFQECALTGFNSADAVIKSRTWGNTRGGDEPPMLLRNVKRAGELALIKMNRVTCGANTHKGLIFSLGLLCAAYGWLIRSKTDFTVGELFDFCRDVSAPVIEDIFETSEDRGKNGSRAAGPQAHGAMKTEVCTGCDCIQNELANGFVNIREYGLPMLRSMAEKGYGMNDAGIAVFLAFLAHVDDLAILRSSNAATLRDIQRAVTDFLSTEPAAADIRKWAEETDLQFIEREISAGCSADLLTITFFVWYLL